MHALIFYNLEKYCHLYFNNFRKNILCVVVHGMLFYKTNPTKNVNIALLNSLENYFYRKKHE